MLGSGLEMLARRLEGNKRLKVLMVSSIIMIVFAVFLLSDTLTSCRDARGSAANTGNEGGISSESYSADDAYRLESKLEAKLSMISGVGRVSVMVTFDRTAEQIIASIGKTSSSDKSSSSENRPATVQSGGKEEPIVLSEVLPRIRGVIVIAEGAADISIKFSIKAAVSTVLGVDENIVEVFVMGQ